MKKLFFFTLFLLGMLAATQAQVQLDYHVENLSSTSTWDFKLAEANGASISFNLTPTQSFTGTVTGNFAFPIEWKAVNNLGCQVSMVENALLPETTIPIFCSQPASVVYKIEQIGANQVIFKIGLQ